MQIANLPGRKNILHKELYISNKVGPLGHKRNNMKLYTEEQVLKAIREARYYSDLIKPDNVILKELTPIELPSDEEIEKEEKEIRHYTIYDCPEGFLDGAKWMKDQILNQNK